MRKQSKEDISELIGHKVNSIVSVNSLVINTCKFLHEIPGRYSVY